MSELNKELDDSVLSTGEVLGPLHPDFPRDTTTERFQRTWHRAVSELNGEISRLEELILADEKDRSDTLEMEIKRSSRQAKKFLNTVLELKSEAGVGVAGEVQIIQNAERSLADLERRLNVREEDVATSSVLTQIIDTSTSVLRADCPPKDRSEAFWEVGDGDGDGQPQEDLSSSNIDVIPLVNGVSQTGVTVHRVTSGEIQQRTFSSRVSVVSNASSKVDFTDARNGVDRVAKEAEMQIQSEEVSCWQRMIECRQLLQPGWPRQLLIRFRLRLLRQLLRLLLLLLSRWPRLRVWLMKQLKL
jgi:hypothetical protein